MLQDERIKERYVFVMTHYAPRLKDGKPDTKLHGLINADNFLDVCKSIDSGALLCGHIHETYSLEIEGLHSTLYCAGSATIEGHEGFWVYEVKDKKLEVKAVYWDNGKYTFKN